MEISANILRILNNNLKMPGFILDTYGEVLTLNDHARQLYTANIPVSSFWALFSPESANLVKKCFNEVISSNKSIVESANLIVHSKTAEVTFSTLGENGNRLILCTFDFNSNRTDKLKLTVRTDELKQIIKCDQFYIVLDEIRSSFPFTLLGKAKVRNEVNKLDRCFWLKDTEGKYILVNSKFASNLGLKAAQIEGKYEKEFVPKYLSGFFDAVEEFIHNTTNVVTREGVIHPISSDNKNLTVIEFPLCDLDNRAIAIIGITQDVTERDSHIKRDNDEASLLSIIYGPAALLNSSGEVLNKNSAFLKIESELSDVMKGTVDAEIKSICNGLLNSLGDSVEIKKIFGNVSFVFNVRKLYNTQHNLNYLLLQVLKNSEGSDSEFLFNNREKMYEVLMQASPEPMYIYDVENLRFLEVNKAALDMYGYSRNEFLQMDLTDLYAPEDIQSLLDSGNTKSKESVFTGPWRHKKRDGSSIFVEISKVSFEYKQNKAHFNIIRDITEKIRLNKEIQLYRNVFENTSDLVFITDPDGFITYANSSVMDILGYPKEEFDTRPIVTLVTDDFRSEMSSIFFSSGESSSMQNVEFKQKEGNIIQLDLLFRPVYDYNQQIVSYNIMGKPSGNLSYNQNSVKENSHISTVAQSYSSIDASLLSSMFHEILTPINVILGFVQEITENIENPNEEINEASEIINQNRQVLLQTMDAVLEYSHIEQKRIELKPEKIFFTDILDNLQKNTKKTADANKIEFLYGKISSSLNIETDVHRMETLLTMFISSAMRITKEKSIFISAYQYDDDNYIISLKDGRRSTSDHLADSLNQVLTSDIKDLKRDYGLSKLSIHLAKKLLVLLHGRFEIIRKSGEVGECGIVFPLTFIQDSIGEIPSDTLNTVIETENDQNKFTGTLEKSEHESVQTADPELIKEKPVYEEPIHEEPAVQKQINTDKPESEVAVKNEKNISSLKSSGKIDLHPLKCLYVEDQIDSQILFKVQMKELSHIDFAVSFEAALPLLEQNKYDFIIMDINLQGEYNGLDALKIIRRLPGYADSKIIAVTAYVLPGDKEKFIATGFNDFISKPILREKLIDSLNKVLH